GLQFFQKEAGGPVRSDIHGIDVYEHIDGLSFVAINAEASIGKAAAAFVEEVAAAVASPVFLNAKQELAGEILSASYFDASDRSRFITLITAVEALLDRQPRESIGQAGRALAERLLDGKVYEGQTPAQFFSLCYGLRSSILHSGKVPAEI